MVLILKKLLNPVIRDCGAVPFWPDEVIAKDGMHYRNAIAAAINRSSVKFVDISEKDKVPAPLLLACNNYDDRIILIESGAQGRCEKAHVGGCDILRYSIEVGEEDLFGVNEEFQNAIRGRLASIYGTPEFSRVEMNSAERLFDGGEYNAAVITAWIALEGEMRKGNGRIDLKDFNYRLNELVHVAQGDNATTVRIEEFAVYLLLITRLYDGDGKQYSCQRYRQSDIGHLAGEFLRLK